MRKGAGLSKWVKFFGVGVCSVLVAVSCSWLGDDDGEEPTPGPVSEAVSSVDLEPPEAVIKPTDDGGAEVSWSPVAGATGYEFSFDGAIRPTGAGMCTEVCRVEIDPFIAPQLSEVEVLISSTTDQGSGPWAKIETSDFTPTSFEGEEFEQAPLTVVTVFIAEGPPENQRVESQIEKPDSQQNIQVKFEEVATVEEGLALIEKNSRAENVISVEFAGTGAVNSATKRYQQDEVGVRTTGPQSQTGLDFWPNQGEGVTVAVIDGGVNADHPGLAGATILPGKNFDKGGDGISKPSDHGTEVASVIVGRDPLVGFAPKVSILPIDIYDGKPCCWTPGRFAESIIWAVDNGADVISVSVTVPCISQLVIPGVSKELCWGRDTVQAAVDYATNANVPIVSSAGNTGDMGFGSGLVGRPDNAADLPGLLPEVLTVGSANPSGDVSDFSTEGPFVDVLAPGEYVYVATGDDAFQFKFGTSFSQPIIASLVAVIRAANPALTPAAINTAIGACSAVEDFVNPSCIFRRLDIPYVDSGPDLAALGVPQDMFIQMRMKTSWPGHEALADKLSTGEVQDFPTDDDGFAEFTTDLPGMSARSEAYFGGEGRANDEFVYFTNIYSQWEKRCAIPWDIGAYFGGDHRSQDVATIATTVQVVATGRFNEETGTGQVTISKGVGATEAQAGTALIPEIVSWSGLGNCAPEHETETPDVWSQKIAAGIDSYLPVFPITSTEFTLDHEPSGRECGEVVVDDLFLVKVCGPGNSYQ